MQYTVKWLEKEDKAVFNAFISNHPKGHAMQLWEWGEIKGRTGGNPGGGPRVQWGDICGGYHSGKEATPDWSADSLLSAWACRRYG